MCSMKIDSDIYYILWSSIVVSAYIKMFSIFMSEKEGMITIIYQG